MKWFGTQNNDGVWSFDGTTWVHYTKDNSPLSSTVILVAADRKNVKWFADADKNNTIISFDGTT